MADADVLQRVELALAQSKRVVKEGRISVQQLARLRDHLQPEDPAQGEDNGSTNEEDR